MTSSRCPTSTATPPPHTHTHLHPYKHKSSPTYTPSSDACGCIIQHWPLLCIFRHPDVIQCVNNIKKSTKQLHVQWSQFAVWTAGSGKAFHPNCDDWHASWWRKLPVWILDFGCGVGLLAELLEHSIQLIKLRLSCHAERQHTLQTQI